MPLKENVHNNPDLLCIGPQRCATTWLYRNLKKSPSVHSVISKEIHYFDPFYIPQRKEFNEHRKRKANNFLGLFKYIPPQLGESISKKLSFFHKNFSYVQKMYWYLRIPKEPNDNWYKSLYSKAKPNQITIDYTASYCMLKQDGIQHILRVNPQIKIMIIIRDPIERALSHYKMVQEKNNFEMSLEHFCLKAADKNGFIYQQSDYETILNEWLPQFAKDKIKVLFYDDLKQDPANYLKGICDFAEIELTEDMLGTSAKTIYPTRTNLMLDAESKQILYKLFNPTIESLMIRFPERTKLFKTWQKRYKQNPIDDKNL